MFSKMLGDLRSEIQKLANPQKAKILSGYFKTGKGEYGYGDKFLGINVPDVRKVAKGYVGLSLPDVKKLLQSKIHEQRSAAVEILLMQYQKGDEKKKKEIFSFCLANTKYINNWDLVDGLAPKIIGSWLSDKSKEIIYKLAVSENLWERRIAIISTLTFIRNGQFEDTFKIAEILLKDEHDLIHKAVGWMLREVGKLDRGAEERFLDRHCSRMPRTALRYAIEKFPQNLRQRYLKLKF